MIVDLKTIERDWQKRGYSFGIWTDPPGQVWKDYKHNMDELFMVVEGRVKLEMEGRIITTKEGEEVLIPANTLHTVSNIGRTTARWLYGYKERR